MSTDPIELLDTIFPSLCWKFELQNFQEHQQQDVDGEGSFLLFPPTPIWQSLMKIFSPVPLYRVGHKKLPVFEHV